MRDRQLRKAGKNTNGPAQAPSRAGSVYDPTDEFDNKVRVLGSNAEQKAAKLEQRQRELDRKDEELRVKEQTLINKEAELQERERGLPMPIKRGSAEEMDAMRKQLNDIYERMKEMEKKEFELRKTLKDLDLDWVLGAGKPSKSTKPASKSAERRK